MISRDKRLKKLKKCEKRQRRKSLQNPSEELKQTGQSIHLLSMFRNPKRERGGSVKTRRLKLPESPKEPAHKRKDKEIQNQRNLPKVPIRHCEKDPMMTFF